MQTKVTARHFDLTPEIRAKAEEEIEGLTRFFDRIISAEFTLDTERHRRIAELSVKVHAHTLTGHAETDDMITAIAAAAEKVIVQLKKFKGKMKDHKADEIHEMTDAATRPTTDVDDID